MLQHVVSLLAMMPTDKMERHPIVIEHLDTSSNLEVAVQVIALITGVIALIILFRKFSKGKIDK